MINLKEFFAEIYLKCEETKTIHGDNVVINFAIHEELLFNSINLYGLEGFAQGTDDNGFVRFATPVNILQRWILEFVL